MDDFPPLPAFLSALHPQEVYSLLACLANRQEKEDPSGASFHASSCFSFLFWYVLSCPAHAGAMQLLCRSKKRTKQQSGPSGHCHKNRYLPSGACFATNFIQASLQFTLKSSSYWGGHNDKCIVAHRTIPVRQGHPAWGISNNTHDKHILSNSFGFIFVLSKGLLYGIFLISTISLFKAPSART